MFFISSEDIELSKKECIMLAQACWNETTAVNKNSFKAKLACQHNISKSTLMNWINDQKTASVRNQHSQRLSFEEEAVICDWILRLQTADQWFTTSKLWALHFNINDSKL